MSETLKKILMLDWITWRLTSASCMVAFFVFIFSGSTEHAVVMYLIALLARILHNQEESK